MRKKLFMVLIFLLIINVYVYGKNVNKTKSLKLFHKNTKQKETKSRTKRSLDEDFDKLFASTKDSTHYGHIVEGRGKIVKIQPIIDKEPPFWGSRGRRDSSEEIFPNVELPAYNHQKHFEKINNLHRLYINYENKLRKDEEDSPFWGNRGRRDSSESEENDVNLFWANRGRRQDDEPFWGTRGRRENILRPWAGRRDDDEPFWGNRGRRQEQEPFWGNRGRREKGDRLGSNKVTNTYISNSVDESSDENKNAFEIKLKDTIIETINHIQHKLGKLNRSRRDEPRLPFWNNRGRDSKLMSLFNGKIRNRLHYVLNDPNKAAKNLRSKTFEQNTVNDDRIYAEEPRYILVERSSRSSAEDDPFFISRGKKYSDYDLDNATRGRRGSIEDLVKSVRNDPYYIARGKKQSYIVKSGNSTKSDDFSKTKELICSTVNILMSKFNGNKEKREINDNERNRRTILKKLALQLQMDPYFVSRGKKNDKLKEKSNSEDFINNIVTMCN